MEFLAGQQGTILFILLFLGITFLQSSVDKIMDWKGNVDFITSHFQPSPLRSMVPLSLAIVLILELITSILMVVAVFQICTNGGSDYSLLALQFSGISLLLLLVGQRLAKDYAGAVNLAIYYLLTIFGIYLCV